MQQPNLIFDYRTSPTLRKWRKICKNFTKAKSATMTIFGSAQSTPRIIKFINFPTLRTEVSTHLESLQTSINS